MVTQETLKNLIQYNPLTGEFTNKIRRGRFLADTRPGVNFKNKSIVIVINRKRYEAHRLAYLYMTGKFPENQIDHINGLDNRWSNLRPATSAENNRNKRKTKNSDVPAKGIWKSNNKNKPFRACIKVDYKNIYLGYYKTAADAHEAYKKAAKKHHGDFANYG